VIANNSQYSKLRIFREIRTCRAKSARMRVEVAGSFSAKETRKALTGHFGLPKIP
jgi:hypothetical protein